MKDKWSRHVHTLFGRVQQVNPTSRVRHFTALTLALFISSSAAASITPQSHWSCPRDSRVWKLWTAGMSKVSTADLQAAAIHKPEARPPASMRVTACVEVAIIVGVDGKVRCAAAFEGHPLLRAAAEDAARQWIFKFSDSGKKQESVGSLKFSFNTDSAANACVQSEAKR